MRKTFSVVLIISLILSFGLLSACSGNKYLPEYESGFWKYAVKTQTDGSKEAYLIGLTESGANQTALVYPERIDGIPVYGIGYKRIFVTLESYVGKIESNNLEKIYFPHPPKEEIISEVFDGVTIVGVHWNYEEDPQNLTVWGPFEMAYGYSLIHDGKTLAKDLNPLIGNVSYMYNYLGTPNEGYFWVDSYNEEVISFVPPEPEREGYVFDGWYKEAECLNKWNFDTDKTGKEIVYDRNYPEKYKTYEGISLYAKWRIL